MNVVLTCIYPGPGYELPHQLLEASGLRPAHVSRRESMTPAQLHRAILKAHRIGGTHQTDARGVRVLSPGKLWQELAVDLFLGNLENGTWGWVEPGAIHLLDFWRNFDSQTGFVLAYCSPATVLGGLLRGQPADAETIDRVLMDWQHFNTELLRFYHANRDSCVLVNANGIAQDPRPFVERVTSKLALEQQLTWPNDKALPGRPADACLLEFLARQLVRNADTANALYDELESTADLPAAESGQNTLDIWSDYVSVLQSSAGELAAAKEQIDASALAVAAQEAQCAKLEADRVALMQTHSDLVKREKEQTRELKALTAAKLKLEQDKSALAQQCEAQTNLVEELKLLKDQHQAQQQENELLLLQLHQVQEELERHYLEKTQQQASVDTLTKETSELARAQATLEKEKSTLLAQHKEQTKLLTERQVQIEQLTQTKAKEEQKRNQEITALKQAQVQRDKDLTQITQARDQQAQLANARQVSLETLTKEKAELAQAHAALEKESSALVLKQKDHHKEQQQENELLLLQLHQVQEELERHFLEKTQQRASLDTLTKEKTELARAQAALEKEKSALVAQHKEQAKLLTERQAQIEHLTQTKAKEEQKRNQEITALKQTQAQRDKDISQLTHARDQQAQLANTRQAALDELAKEKAELAQAHAVVEKEKSTLEVQRKEQAKRDEQLEQLKKQQQEQQQENELLLLQLHQVQEELEFNFLENQRLRDATPVTRPSRAIARDYPPVEVLYDLRKEIDGDNWYYAEHDGRWAGPEASSLLRVPALSPGRYRIQLCVVDAMDPEILSGMKGDFNGVPVDWNIPEKITYPQLIDAEFTAAQGDTSSRWTFTLQFSRLISPADRGSDDYRQLAIRVSSLRITQNDAAVSRAENETALPVKNKKDKPLVNWAFGKKPKRS